MLSSLGAPLTLPTLPWDVLEYVISYLSPQEAVALSTTCKAIHSVSMNPALHTVVLDGSIEQIKKFRDYLLAEVSRPMSLRSLVLTKALTWIIGRGVTCKMKRGFTWEIEQDAANALADILDKSARLQLFTCGSMEAVNYASDGRVARALVALTDLQEVNVRGGGTDTMEVIVSLNSRHLRIVNVSLVHGKEMPYDTFFAPLTRYTHLHTLSISKLYTTLQFPLHLQNTVSIVSVHTLSIDYTTIPLSHIVSMFPNVKHVSYQSGRYERNRLTNLKEPLPPSWPHTLSRARIDVADVDIWPLSCRVNCLDFSLFRSSHSREALLLIGQTKPRIISCAYHIDGNNLNFFWIHLHTVATDLRFVEARIIELSSRYKRYVFMHLSRLEDLTVIFLSIRAYYELSDPDDLDAELESIARDLAQKNRQLRFVGISLLDGRSVRHDDPMQKEELLASRWWAVERVDRNELELDVSPFFERNNALLVPIPIKDGLKVRDYMYQADYESPDWQERLSALTSTGVSYPPSLSQVYDFA